MGSHDLTLPPSKLPTFHETQDVLPTLPDSIIYHIFSFLETIDVIRASAVASRWRYLWFSSPYLDFNFNNFCEKSNSVVSTEECLNRFKDFVNWVLSSQNGSYNIQKLRLRCVCLPNDYSILRWINIAARRNVQEVDLILDSFWEADRETVFELPHYFSTCQSLLVFKLNCQHRILKLPNYQSFSHLISLHLKNAKFLDGIEPINFLSPCVLLHKLIIEYCYFCDFKTLHISLPNLQKLKFQSNDLGDPCTSAFKVTCPNLTCFEFQGVLPQRFILHNQSSLETVSIFIFYYPHKELGNISHEILKGLENVKVLKLNLVILKYLHCALAKSNRFFTTFGKLKSLKLKIGWSICFWEVIISLMKSCPHLEDLFIELSLLYEADDEWEMGDEEGIVCLRYHLKKVELVFYEERRKVMELIRFFLKNGNVLEKVSVFCKEEPMEMMEEVMKFPASSSNVSITIQ